MPRDQSSVLRAVLMKTSVGAFIFEVPLLLQSVDLWTFRQFAGAHDGSLQRIPQFDVDHRGHGGDTEMG